MYIFTTRKIIRWGITILLIALLGTYGAYQARRFLEGPQLVVLYPETGTTFRSPLLPIRGSARNISHLSLNGREIFTDSEGRWAEQLLLSEGYNIIEVKVVDRFEREASQILELILKKDTTSTPSFLDNPHSLLPRPEDIKEPADSATEIEFASTSTETEVSSDTISGGTSTPLEMGTGTTPHATSSY